MKYDESKLLENGWEKTPIGYKRTTRGKREVQGFKLYVRETKLQDKIGDKRAEIGSFSKKCANTQKLPPPKNAENTSFSAPKNVGSQSPMGNPEPGVTPAMLPVLADFGSYPSLTAARPDKPCILIACDSEWQTLDKGRDMISWQFAFVKGAMLVEMVFIKVCQDEDDLPLTLALGCILDYLGVCSVDLRKIRRYKYCSGWDSSGNPVVSVTDNVHVAVSMANYVYRGRDIGFTHEQVVNMPDAFAPRNKRDWAWFHSFLDFSLVDSVKVCLVCHSGNADISTFSDIDFVLRCCTEVQGGLVTLQPIRLSPKSLVNVSHDSVFPVSLSIADTMCHAPAGMKKLKNLGDVVGIPKIDIPDAQKSSMLSLLENSPCLFMEYASTDSVVTLMYCSALYGYNNTPPVTVTSAAASVMRGSMMSYMNVDNTDDFNKKYRGLVKVSHGKVQRPDNLGYLDASSLEPMSDSVHSVQYFSSQAYHGGYNSCSEVGYFPQETYDYDLQNAYPTAMCLVPDIDWGNPIKFEIRNRNLDLRDFQMFGNLFNPLLPFVAYVRFKFPDSVKFPCIPVNVDGVPVYPRTSDGLNGVYVAGSFIYLALRLGAEVFCETGYVLNTLLTDDYQESRSLAHAVLQLVKDRNRAKAKHGKKSLEELILKVMVNSGYGKNAQNVIDKSSWSAFRDCMESLGCSAITNPFSAMMTTSVVQCELLAAQNQMFSLGYVSCSVTTDGFISDCPEDVLKRLDLYGFRPFMEQARRFLTDNKDSELWEIKHHQNDLINFCTRGNVSLLPHGVCAHNSTKSGFAPDSYEDRLWVMVQVLSRTGTVDYNAPEFPSHKDLVHGKPYVVKSVLRHIHMDFDMKRKPDRKTFKTDYPVVAGVTYEIAHFDTIPYENVAEFRLYRAKKKLVNCLRTQAEWNLFFVKIETNNCGMRVKDLDWAIIVSVIMGYRAGKWDIPDLNGLTVAEKCDWINKHNDSNKKFKPTDWKNCRRPERQVNMLADENLLEKLAELGAVMKN